MSADLFDLTRSDWWQLAISAVAIVAINKVGIQDQGSGWSGLLTAAFFAGRGVVPVRRILRHWWRGPGDPRQA